MEKYPAYKKGVVDCTIPPDLSHVAGKSIVITGGTKMRLSKPIHDLILRNGLGASGMGEQATRAFARAGYAYSNNPARNQSPEISQSICHLRRRE